MAAARQYRAPRDKRRYVRVAVDIADNPKLAAIDDPRAGWAYVVALTISGASLSDGFFVVAPALRKANCPSEIGDALIGQALWHLPGHDCGRCPQPPQGKAVVHDYLDHNESAESMNGLSEARRAAGLAGANKRWHDGRPPPTTPGPGVSHSPPQMADAMASAIAPAIPDAMAPAMASAMANAWQTDSRLRQRQELPPPTPPEINSRTVEPHPGEGEDDLNQETDADRLAVLVVEILTIRNDWSERTVARVAADALLDRRGNFPLVAEAFRIVARATNPETTTPGRLLKDGPWWAEARRTLQPGAAPPTRRAAPVYANVPPADPVDQAAADYRHPFAASALVRRPGSGAPRCGHPGCGAAEADPRHGMLRLVESVA